MSGSNPPIIPVLIALAPEYATFDLQPEGGWRPVRCLFHGDRHASASYNADENVFVCHTCGLRGDAYELVKEIEHVGFPDAKRRVAEILGSSSSAVPTALAGTGRRERSRLPERKGTAAERRKRLQARSRHTRIT